MAFPSWVTFRHRRVFPNALYPTRFPFHHDQPHARHRHPQRHRRRPAFIIDLIETDSVYGSTEDAANPRGPAYLQALAAIDADPNQSLLIAGLDGEPVGTFQLTFTPGIARKGAWRCTVEAVHVSPAHRNKKIGEAMMNWAIRTARARNCATVQLTSNKARTNAHRFYNRLGFTQSHEGFKLTLE